MPLLDLGGIVGPEAGGFFSSIIRVRDLKVKVLRSNFNEFPARPYVVEA